MKNLFRTGAFALTLVLAMALFALPTMGSSSPFPTWLTKYIRSAPVENDNQLKRTARATYDASVQGGSTGTKGLGVFLPTNAIITRSYLYVKTAFTSVSGATIALQCEDANNILTAQNVWTSPFVADTLVEGASTGATSAMKKSIAAACEVSAVVASQAVTSGKMNIFIDYVVQD